jgi:hypothetical protein
MEKAQRSGMSAGEYARSRTMRGIARKKNKPKTVEAFGAQTRALLHELRKQGTNLNQIIHHCHRHQIPPPPAVVELAGSLKALWKQLSS